jgi:predicted PurR-regulated permease PerM
MMGFLMKCVLLFAVLMTGIVIGLQQAHKGIERLHVADKNHNINLINNDLGNEEMTFLGEKLSSSDLLKKHKQLEDVKAFNFFSSLGSFLSNSLSKIIDFIISLIFKVIEIIV